MAILGIIRGIGGDFVGEEISLREMGSGVSGLMSSDLASTDTRTTNLRGIGGKIGVSSSEVTDVRGVVGDFIVKENGEKKDKTILKRF